MLPSSKLTWSRAQPSLADDFPHSHAGVIGYRDRHLEVMRRGFSNGQEVAMLQESLSNVLVF